ncbi:Cytochrome P450 [Vigna angularis]|uniref:Cytochrome P450 n=3 Tax=Phaseolus angularis TaxID=3914 RepID=A0A8T0JVP3_PHAAN|nr:cytochrome P450 CYP82D47 [Vigna angularis]KAG2380939.1 Cytochrome P450 [Vigna angularis]
MCRYSDYTIPMDSASYFPTFAGILALLIAYKVVRFIRSPKQRKGTKVPEPHGALPLIGHLYLLNGRIPYFRTFSAMAEKYGPVFCVKLGCHPTIVVNNREIAKECLTTNDRIFASRPNTSAGRLMGYNNAVFALAPYGNYWREIRKMAVLEILSSHRLEKLKHVRDSETLSLVKNLYSSMTVSSAKNVKGSTEVAISNLLEHMTFNIIVRMIAGKRFGGDTSNDEDNEAWKLRKAIKDATYLSGVFVVADAIPSLSWFDFQGHLSFMKRTAMKLDSILERWLQEHVKTRGEMKNGGCERDFMDVMLSSFEEENICGYKRDIVIKATSLILVLTGSGSTAITLTWALSLLLNHPKVLKAALQELDTHVGKERWVEESDIKNLNYLHAIIKETLRLYPPAPLTGIREATEDCSLVGYHVPKGTRLLINLWNLQRDPEVWPNPDEFQPERFLTTHRDIDFMSQDFELIPFSIGRRSCPGMTFGLQVTHLTLARLLQGFHIFTKDGADVDMTEGLGVALPKEQELRLILQPRLPLGLYESL